MNDAKKPTRSASVRGAPLLYHSGSLFFLKTKSPAANNAKIKPIKTD